MCGLSALSRRMVKLYIANSTLLLPFSTDNLITEFNTDTGVFVPANLVQSFFIEYFYAVELLFKTIQFTEVDKMVTYSRHQFYILAGQDVDLLDLCIPERILLQKYTKLI